MITNPNFNPEKLAEFKEMDRVSRYENGKQRMLVDMRIRQANEPWERQVMDAVDELDDIVDISEVEE